MEKDRIAKVDFEGLTKEMLAPEEIFLAHNISEIPIILNEWLLKNNNTIKELSFKDGIYSINGIKVIFSVFLIADNQLLTVNDKPIIERVFEEKDGKSFLSQIPKNCKKLKIKNASLLDYCTYHSGGTREVRYAIELDKKQLINFCSCNQFGELPNDILWHLSNFSNN